MAARNPLKARPPIVREHLVLFLDVLGFTEATAGKNPTRTRALFKLLQEVKSFSGPFQITNDKKDGVLYRVNVKPEFSAFSDNLVASFPLFRRAKVASDPAHPLQEVADLLDEEVEELYLRLATQRARWLVAGLAHHALALRFLVRGGLTIGKLHHSDGIVFGEGMVDAHRLESKVAVYPRVAVSSRVYLRLKNHDSLATDSDGKTSKMLIPDSDGIMHLDYIPRMKLRFPAKKPNNASWEGDMNKIIDKQIASLEATEQWAAFAKWSWFKGRFKPK